MLAKKTSRNRITLPKRILEQLPAAQYFDVTAERCRILLRPVELKSLANVQAKLREIGIREADIRRALVFARRRSPS